MPGVKAKWTGGAQFLAADEAGHVVVTDAEGQGFKPPDLLLASLVGCAGIDIVRILEKKRQAFTAVEVSIQKRNAPDPPWTIEKIEIEWVVTGTDLKEKAVRDAVQLAEERYCSVSASLKSEIVSTIRLVEAGQEPVGSAE
ncbi:MAG: OsmC family protein [Anaerolineae bacterium]|nr:OsmC family protein [Anaerolineae bacterium]